MAEQDLTAEETIKFIESYFVTTIQPDETKMHHIDEAEWQSVKSRLLAKALKHREELTVGEKNQYEDIKATVTDYGSEVMALVQSGNLDGLPALTNEATAEIETKVKHRVIPVCPQCKGAKQVVRQGMAYHCPTCQGIGKDRPDREKLKSAIKGFTNRYAHDYHRYVTFREGVMTYGMESNPDVVRELDQILALFDEAEIRRQEKE